MNRFRSHLVALARPTGLAGAIAVAAILVAYLIGQGVFDAEMEVDIGGGSQNVTLGAAVGVTVAFVAIGGITAAGLATIARRAAGVFIGLAVAVFAVMSIGPIVGGADTATTITLLVMHSVVLVPVLIVVVPALRARASDASSSTTV